MIFENEILAPSLPVWDACARTDFVRGLASGELPEEAFRTWLVQDCIYLRAYARCWGMAIYRADSFERMARCRDALDFVSGPEAALRRAWLGGFGLSEGDALRVPPCPQTRRYVDFLRQTAEAETSDALIVALLPCLLSYGHIFQKIRRDGYRRDSRYRAFIEEHGGAAYALSCAAWRATAEELCAHRAPEERAHWARLFHRASLMELHFWKLTESGGCDHAI